MKKTKLILFIGIGLLAFLPFIRTTVAAPPCWVGVYEGESYSWQYNNHTAAALGDWTTDGVVYNIFLEFGVWCGWADEMLLYGPMPGTMNSLITLVGDLSPDVEYGSNYESVEVIHAVNFTPSVGTPYDWEDKSGTGTNFWSGLIIENSTEYALFHNGLMSFFDSYDPLGYTFLSLWVSTQIDWTEVVATANTELAGTNATVTVVTDASVEVGFKITISAFGTNTKAIELTVTFDDGLLDVYDLKYDGTTVLDAELVQGSSQFEPCPTPAPGIPGYELPIIIGVASIISLILVKKIRKK